MAIVNANKDNFKGFNIRAVIFFSLGAVASISNAAYIASLPYYNVAPFFTYMGMVSFVISVAFIIAAFVLYFYVVGEIRYKHKKYLI